MTQVVAWLHRLVERLGFVGIGGLMCMAAALLVYLSSGRPLAQQREGLQTQLGALGPTPATAAAARDESAAAQLSRFYAGFPVAADSARSIGRIQAAARRAGLDLQSGEYRLEGRGGERLQRYGVVLPVRGSYVQIRAFIDGVLADLPHAALEDVQLRRESAASPYIDARLRLTLFLRALP